MSTQTALRALARTEPVPLCDLKRQYGALRRELRPAIENAGAKRPLMVGPPAKRLEQVIAADSQCRHGTAVSSGIDAPLLAQIALVVDTTARFRE